MSLQIMSGYRETLNQRLRALQLEDPPLPWKRVASHTIGGLTEVGYSESTDLLLVISSEGRSLFDCLSGTCMAKDHEVPGTNMIWYEPARLIALGINALSDQFVRLAGWHGGGLPRFTKDGWSLELVSPDWPNTSIIISPPYKSVFIDSNSEGCVKIAEDYEIRAYGFSETGRSFVIAKSHALEIFSRPNL
jgi:hypothetical protein